MTVWILLAIWLGVAATLVLPIRRYLVPQDCPSVIAWLFGSAASLLWPWAAFMWVRRSFLTGVIHG